MTAAALPLEINPFAALVPPAPEAEFEAAAPALSSGLRPYQARAVQDVLAATDERVLVVIPTAGGKSHCIAELSRIKALDGSVLVVTHRKELVRQNALKICDAMGGSDHVGIYSAGLGMKTVRRVTVGGIQPMVRIPEALIPADTTTVIVDRGRPAPAASVNEGSPRGQTRSTRRSYPSRSVRRWSRSTASSNRRPPSRRERNGRSRHRPREAD